LLVYYAQLYIGVSDCSITPNDQFYLAISWREPVTFVDMQYWIKCYST